MKAQGSRIILYTITSSADEDQLSQLIGVWALLSL